MATPVVATTGVATPVANGQTAVTEAAGYYIISGHRRHMAQLPAFALRDWAAEHPETEISIEVARTMLAALVESPGSLEALVASLLGKYGAEEIPFVLFEGSQKAVSPAGATAVLLNAPHVSPGAIRG